MDDEPEYPVEWDEYCRAAQEMARVLREDAERARRWVEFDAYRAAAAMRWGSPDRGRGAVG